MKNFDDLAPEWLVKLMAEFGLTDYQAAGLLGNLGFESIGFTTLQEIAPLVEGSRGGFGVAQWTGPRRRNFETWCLRHHLPPASNEANYGFLLHELRGEYASTVKALKGCKTLEAAVFSFGQTYERPYGTTRTYLPGYEGRLHWGRRALAGSRGDAPDATPHPVLRRGSEGEAVSELQRRLKALGYATGPVDGSFGPRTEAAVSAFQAARRILVDGIVGNQGPRSTWNQIAQAESERSTSS